MCIIRRNLEILILRAHFRYISTICFENQFIWIFILWFSQLQGNGITGKIPEEFGNLTNLTMLDLENNHLTGEIPSSLGKLNELVFL